MRTSRRQSTGALRQMTRLSGIALFFAAPLLLTQPALAQDCFCDPAPFGVSPFGVALPMAAETPDTTIESVLLLPTAAAPSAPATPTVLWCTNGNDPRCMPMQPSDAPAFRALSGGPVAIGVDVADTHTTRVARELTSMTPAEGLSPARGVQRSLDRPPRG